MFAFIPSESKIINLNKLAIISKHGTQVRFQDTADIHSPYFAYRCNTEQKAADVLLKLHSAGKNNSGWVTI